jgi:hypothetical protein
MRLQNTQLRDKLEAYWKVQLQAAKNPEEQARVNMLFNSVQDDAMGLTVCRTIEESAEWQSIVADRNKNSVEELQPLHHQEGIPTMPSTSSSIHTHIANIKKHVGKDHEGDVSKDIDALMASLEAEKGKAEVAVLRETLAADLAEVGKRMESKIEKFSSVLAKPTDVLVSIGWRTAEFFLRLGIAVGVGLFTVWVLKKMFEATSMPAMAAVPA